MATAAMLVAAVLVTNTATDQFGMVPVAPGVVAPAGVYAAGLVFTLRDVLHELAGVRVVLAVVGAGALVSALASPRLAAASAAAFTVSELTDTVVYARLRRRHTLVAVLASNTAGAFVDSVLFLSAAFGSLALLPGQILGKSVATGLALPVLAVMRPAVASPR